MQKQTSLLWSASLLAGVLLIQSVRAADYEQNLEKSFPASAGGKLVIQADRGSLDVATDGKDKVEITVFRKVSGGNKAQADDLFTNHEVTFTQNGNTVSVVAKNSGRSHVSNQEIQFMGLGRRIMVIPRLGC